GLIDDVHHERASFTPSMVRHAEQTMTIVAKLTDDWKRGLYVFGALDDYVFGHALRSVHHVDENFEALIPYLEEMLETGDFPHLKRYRDLHGYDIASPDAFEQGLQVVLEGIEGSVASLPSQETPMKSASQNRPSLGHTSRSRSGIVEIVDSCLRRSAPTGKPVTYHDVCLRKSRHAPSSPSSSTSRRRWRRIVSMTSPSPGAGGGGRPSNAAARSRNSHGR